MAWDLHGSKLPDGAKDYLSVLGSCGDEEQARRECEVSAADVARWSRDDEFIDHRRQALAHFEGWKDWKQQDTEDPFRTPPRSRLDKLFDPFRRGAPAPDASPAYLRAFGDAARAIGAAETDGERAAPGEQRFVAFEDLTPQQVAVANAQHAPQTSQQGGMPIDQASFPWPTDSGGRALPGVRGEVSLVPGVGPVNEPGGK